MSTISPPLPIASQRDLQDIVREDGKVFPVGSGTKPALSSAAPNARALDLRGLQGITEYEPAEYTITALAGTRVSELEQALARNDQYLPFDPVFVRAGTTVGGSVASGLSGPGRLRYGGIRDFILGARFVDGRGRLIRGGGKVVKNAAGFDFPKLLVGSIGRLGVLVDATFKVFPRPAAFATVRARYEGLGSALEDLQRLSVSPLELLAMDLEVADGDPGFTLAIRMGGSLDLIVDRTARLRTMLPESSLLEGDAEAQYWTNVTEFTWVAPTAALVKVPLTPSKIPVVDAVLQERPQVRRYSVAGNVLWLAWDQPLSQLHNLLETQRLSGMVLRGDAAHPLMGLSGQSEFARRVKDAIDPDGKFLELDPV